MAGKIAGWVRAGAYWHAVRQDGRAACGKVSYTGAPIPFTAIPAGRPPGFCQRIGCDNARRHAQAAVDAGILACSRCGTWAKERPGLPFRFDRERQPVCAECDPEGRS